MSVKLTITGLDELRAALRALPEALHAEAGHLALAAANGAAVAVRTNYGRHRRTGKLQDGVEVVPFDISGTVAGAELKSTHYLAAIVEIGAEGRHESVDRHYTTAGGARHFTGRMPPMHAFVGPVVRARRQMNEQLIDLLRRQGLVVTGAL